MYERSYQVVRKHASQVDLSLISPTHLDLMEQKHICVEMYSVYIPRLNISSSPCLIQSCMTRLSMHETCTCSVYMYTLHAMHVVHVQYIQVHCVGSPWFCSLPRDRVARMLTPGCAFRYVRCTPQSAIVYTHTSRSLIVLSRTFPSQHYDDTQATVHSYCCKQLWPAVMTRSTSFM